MIIFCPKASWSNDCFFAYDSQGIDLKWHCQDQVLSVQLKADRLFIEENPATDQQIIQFQQFLKDKKSLGKELRSQEDQFNCR